MIAVEKIYENDIYKECMQHIIKNSKIDIQNYINEVSKKAVEIAENLKINTDIIEKAITLTYLGLSAEQEDYIKSSGILAVKILSDLGEDEDTIARVLMAIAGQGNDGNSINIFSAVILLASLINLKTYMMINKFSEASSEEIKLEKFELLYFEKIINYQFIVSDTNKEIQTAIDRINKMIEKCSQILQLRVLERDIIIKSE